MGRIITANCSLPDQVFRNILPSAGNSKRGVIVSREVFEGQLLGDVERNFLVGFRQNHC